MSGETPANPVVDQLGAAARDWATTLVAYRTLLVEGGFPETAATEMAVELDRRVAFLETPGRDTVDEDEDA